MSYKAVPHLDHADMLEVAVYRKDHPFDKEPISTITVECTKCGEVVEEVYNASEDNTSPLDVEFPPCMHEFTPIAPECGDDDDDQEIWEWCIRCGVLKLGAATFTPGAHQEPTIKED